MYRYLTSKIAADLESKLVFLGGPRQVGKTTLSRSVSQDSQVYLNFADPADRKIILERAWPKDVPLVVFDELHKWKKWKAWIKGLWDTRTGEHRFLVTGSARLDLYKKGGDSLAGRVFHYRLHPLSLPEIPPEIPRAEAYERLMSRGGFPEPFLNPDPAFAKRWRRGHIDRILREDLLDLEQVRELKKIEMLTDLLADRVGSPISYAQLARDLEVSGPTVKRWLQLLESLFVLFIVTPYSKNVAKAVLKEPKVYFFDNGRVIENRAARLENMVACALLKRNQFLEDTQGERMQLHYVRDREKREVDFLTLRERSPEWLVEVNSSDAAPSPALARFKDMLCPSASFQVLDALDRRQERNDMKIVPASEWLAGLEA